MAAIGNRDFLCRSQQEDRDVWNQGIGEFWKELNDYNSKLQEPATAPALIDRATAVAEWRTRQFKTLLNAVAESRLRHVPQGDQEGLKDLISGIAYIYQRFAEKTAKDPSVPATGSLIKFLKKIQAGTVISLQRGEFAPVQEPLLDIVAQGDPLHSFKLVLTSPEIPDEVKFRATAEGFQFAYMIMRHQAQKLQKLMLRVGELEVACDQEKKVREDLKKRLDAKEEKVKSQDVEMTGLKEKLNKSEKTKTELNEKLKKSDEERAKLEEKNVRNEERSRQQDQQLQVLRGQTQVLSAQAVQQREKAKKNAEKAFDRAYDDVTKWEILSGLTFMMGFPKLKAVERRCALLYAQWRYFDKIEAIRDLAERTRKINIFANEYLRSQGCFARITGKNVYSNGRWYVGEFFDDDTLVTGKILKGPDGYWYKGPFYDGVPHGKGEERTREGTYIGEFEHGLRHGEGRWELSNGDVYDGEFKFGVRWGRGVLLFANGDIYDGEFEEDLYHSDLSWLYYDSGDHYLGAFRRGKFHGEGQLEFTDGSYYHGGFEDGRFCGYGIYRFEDGSLYVGQFKDGMAHGRGTLTWADGRQYTGEFREDQVYQGEDDSDNE